MFPTVGLTQVEIVPPGLWCGLPIVRRQAHHLWGVGREQSRPSCFAPSGREKWFPPAEPETNRDATGRKEPRGPKDTQCMCPLVPWVQVCRRQAQRLLVLLSKSRKAFKQADAGFGLRLFVDGGDVPLQCPAGEIQAVGDLLHAILGGQQLFQHLRFTGG